jgi:hypothetical protein
MAIAIAFLLNRLSLGASETQPSSPFEIALHPSEAEAPDATAGAAQTTYGTAIALEESRQYAVCVCFDQNAKVWVGTENGVQQFDPTAPKWAEWTRFTTQDGLGDDYAYAMACDHRGRIWVGHLNHGVSCYNGQRWQNYEVIGGLSSPGTLSGPLGERVFHIAVCPTDGDVWIATNAGISRYSDKNDTWSYYTRAEGLPSDQANSIAFDADGNVYVATQCDGIAIAGASDGYKSWRQVSGPYREPTAPKGQGLPSNLINDILVSRRGVVYAATDTGLACSSDSGQSWTFTRGRDYSAKARGLTAGPPPAWKPHRGAVLSEDYCTSLAEDDKGNLWVGHRKTGYDILDERSLTLKETDAGGEYVTSVLPYGSAPVAATYGSGLISLGNISGPLLNATKAIVGAPDLPAGASPPGEKTLIEMTSGVNAAVSDRLTGAYLGEDWATQGDWLGRYGRKLARLCGSDSPHGDYSEAESNAYALYCAIGPHFENQDNIRRYIAELNTDDQRALWDPSIGHRSVAEWDDHGEAYAFSHEGPDIWLRLTVPAGTHDISAYFLNDDAESHFRSSWRDYLVELRRCDGEDKLKRVEVAPAAVQRMREAMRKIAATRPAKYPALPQIPDHLYIQMVNAEAAAREPVLAHCRVEYFFGGVYKTFRVAGPGSFSLHIIRNGSKNTMCSGVFVDGVGQAPDSDNLVRLSDGLRYNPPAIDIGDFDPTAATQAWDALDAAAGSTAAMLVNRKLRILSYRAVLAGPPLPNVLPNWRWRLRLWSPADRDVFKQTMEKAWAGMLRRNPQLQSRQQ